MCFSKWYNETYNKYVFLLKNVSQYWMWWQNLTDIYVYLPVGVLGECEEMVLEDKRTGASVQKEAIGGERTTATSRTPSLSGPQGSPSQAHRGLPLRATGWWMMLLLVPLCWIITMPPSFCQHGPRHLTQPHGKPDTFRFFFLLLSLLLFPSSFFSLSLSLTLYVSFCPQPLFLQLPVGPSPSVFSCTWSPTVHLTLFRFALPLALSKYLSPLYFACHPSSSTE